MSDDLTLELSWLEHTCLLHVKIDPDVLGVLRALTFKLHTSQVVAITQWLPTGTEKPAAAEAAFIQRTLPNRVLVKNPLHPRASHGHCGRRRAVLETKGCGFIRGHRRSNRRRAMDRGPWAHQFVRFAATCWHCALAPRNANSTHK